MKNHEKILKAFANRRRLAIIKYIKVKKEANVGEIATHLKLSFKSTSRHLAILSGADILEKDQQGLAVYYSLTSQLPSLAKAVISEV